MSLRGLILATQLLTRLRIPVPSAPSAEMAGREWSSCAWWFPVVGLFVGLAALLPLVALRPPGPLIAAAASVAAWVWITGAMHLDGLADLADALGAAHRDPRKLFAVLADPHVGTFGVVSVGLVLLLKFALLAEMPAKTLPAVALIPAWARLGALAWSRWLPSLKGGSGQQLASGLPALSVFAWGAVLLVASAFVAPVLILAPLVIAAWAMWLRARLGGMTGDCLGAGIELTEVLLLAALAAGSHLQPPTGMPRLSFEA